MKESGKEFYKYLKKYFCYTGIYAIIIPFSILSETRRRENADKIRGPREFENVS